ncbi:MAG: hypothetical protein RL685_4632 [Pseudomonadota bacterium]|jgi:hypothetical protein
MNRNPTNSEKQPQRPAPPSARGKKPQRDEPSPAQKPGVEGEGSYTASRRYNDGVREHLENNDVEREGEEAREALEGDEREALEAAEEQGKRGATPGGVRPVQQTESGLGGPQPHGKG